MDANGKTSASAYPSFPRSISTLAGSSLDSGDYADSSVLLRSDIGIFWDLRRHHLGDELTTVESIVIAIKFHADLIRHFCVEWLGINGLNQIVKFAVVCDLPHATALEVKKQRIMEAFDEYQIQFSNVGANNSNVPVARREGICRFVHQFLNDFPNPTIVIVSDDLRTYQSVKVIAKETGIIPIIRHSRHGSVNHGYSRRFYNRLLASSIVVHPWDVYFYETAIETTTKDRRYPKNCLQILYTAKRDTRTHRTPLLAWLASFALESLVLHILNYYSNNSLPQPLQAA